MDVTLRRLHEDDSFEELTDLLHRAYAPLGEAGMNFTAVDQGVATTRSRCSEGECWVGEVDGRIVGTIVWGVGCGDHDPAYYQREGVAHFNQFAVDPEVQGKGVGQALLNLVEQHAREAGFAEMALDTAAPALELLKFYAKLGYAEVNRHQWLGKSYESVIMAKRLILEAASDFPDSP